MKVIYGFLIIIVCLVGVLLAINFIIWSNKTYDEQAVNNSNDIAYADDFTVDKLNSQAPVVKLRKSLLNGEFDNTVKHESLDSYDVKTKISTLKSKVEKIEKQIQ